MATAPEGPVKTAMVRASLPNGWVGTIPQTATPATLQFLLGFLALATAGIVAVAGRSIPARRS
jgi:hypothetical protein